MSNKTPRKHFAEDIARAIALLDHADELSNSAGDSPLVIDLRHSAVAMAVGAMDAYFCDAYVDCLTTALRAYVSGKWKGNLPAEYANRELPAGEVLDTSRQRRPLWAIRMAARKIMERDSMLNISRIDELFNPALPDRQKLWSTLIDALIPYGLKRITKYSEAEVSSLSGSKLGEAKKKAAGQLKRRLGETVQLRHDWIHNCGRPKSAVTKLTKGVARSRIQELALIVSEFDDHIQQHRLA